MGVARLFPPLPGCGGPQNWTVKFVLHAGQSISLSRSSLHSQISVASGHSISTRDVWFEREVGVARTALEFRRPLVHAGHQHFEQFGQEISLPATCVALPHGSLGPVRYKVALNFA